MAGPTGHYFFGFFLSLGYNNELDHCCMIFGSRQMFGYVVVNEPELKIREYHLYRSYYCGMCMDLKEAYGQTGRLTLSYDTVFLALLLTSLYEPQDRLKSVRCAMHPFEKHPTRQNEYTRYASDMGILLSYHSCLDDWNDERDSRKKLMALVLKNKSEKAAQIYSDKAALIADKLDALHALEEQALSTAADPPSPPVLLDRAGGIFGDLMAEIFDFKGGTWSPALRRIGFFLGKYIYILDAFDDLEKDAASGNFNPLVPLRDRPDLEGYVRGILTMAASECCAAFETLPIVENIDILRNILYSGIWCKFEEKCHKRAKADASASAFKDSSTERTAQDE